MTDQLSDRLQSFPYMRDYLYSRGFIITDANLTCSAEFPFYSNWWHKPLSNRYNVYLHKDQQLYTYRVQDIVFFLIGHAVDPFQMISDEEQILRFIASKYLESNDSLWKVESNLTGVFLFGIIKDDKLVFTTDCAGMQIVYYGKINEKVFITSHSKLVGDLCALQRDSYIDKLIHGRYYHFFGIWLPGDLSPYKELQRLVPNHSISFDSIQQNFVIERFFPWNTISPITSKEEYAQTIKSLSDIIERTLELISKKWSNQKIAISVTGGRDSTTTLACANGIYEKFNYFSYISNKAEKVDAEAAHNICSLLGLEHNIYFIPETVENEQEYETFRILLEYNSGCIGHNNANDVRKRLYFAKNHHFDIEVKSWVNELGRGSQYVKYNKKRFPRKPTAALCRAMHKIYLSPSMIHRTDKFFRRYLKTYYSESDFVNAPWLELYWWEFCWSGGEGLHLTAEHRPTFEIFVPFNNRYYVASMLSVPLKMRRADRIPADIIALKNQKIVDSKIVVKDLEHNNKRALIMRLYLELFSKIHI